jgi:hypothetical protein
MLKNGLKEAPFSAGGDLEHYAGYSAEWRPNTPMELELAISGMTSGYSAKYLNWVDADGHSYPMFVSDLIDMLREVVVEHGTIHAMFQVRKRGQNFGLCYAGPVPAQEVAA